MAFAAATAFLSAQPNLTVTMPSPMQNQTIGPNAGFDFIITVANTGTIDLTSMDTVTFAPLVEGGLLTDQNGNPLVYNYVGPINVGSSRTDTLSFASFTVTGLPATQLNWCAFAFANGPNFNGLFSESDTTDNAACVDINYDPVAVSIDENETYTINFKPVNNSYYANNTIYVRVDHISNNDAVSLNLIDLNGRTVYSQSLEVNTNLTLEEDVAIDLPTGVYIMQLKTAERAIGHTKLMVN